MAFILGTLPLVIDAGPGSEMRQALGIAVFFGMIGVTLFGLLFTPSFYVPSRKFGAWASERLPGELRNLRLPRLRRARWWSQQFRLGDHPPCCADRLKRSRDA